MNAKKTIILGCYAFMTCTSKVFLFCGLGIFFGKSLNFDANFGAKLWKTIFPDFSPNFREANPKFI